MANFVKVASVNEIQAGQGKAVTVGDREVGLFQCDGKICAVDNVCPHAGGPLSDGDIQGSVVTCPWHGWRFDVCTGVSPMNPAAKITTYEVKVEGNDVLISV